MRRIGVAFAVLTLCCIGPARAQDAPANLLANGGFEKVQAEKPDGWSLGDKGISTLSEEKARTGKRALKIVDASPKDGSNLSSARIDLQPGKALAVRLWCYLHEGKPGLGVYVNYFDAAGQVLHEAREKTMHNAAMAPGEWLPTYFTVTPPAEAKSAAIWLHTFSTAVLTCYVDDVELLQGDPDALAEKGPRMSDAEFFAALDLDAPGLAGVRAAVKAGDLPAAKQALAAHLRARKNPRWTFDWRDHPFRGVKAPAPQDDRAPDQWDYYSTFITLDWQGWKHFTFPKDQLSPRAYVEGSGVKTKQPVGWHWIRHIQFSATGWGLKPDPEAVLYLDGMQLTGKGKPAPVADFEGEAIAWEGLERSGEQAKEGKFAGKWGNHVTTGTIRTYKIPHDWTGYDALEFWAYSPKATGGKIVMVLDSDVPAAFKAADELCAHRFGYAFTGAGKASIQMGERINWAANPTEGDARTHLWNECLNRHFHFAPLGEAYWQSGDEKYARELVAHWLDWIQQNPEPAGTSGNNVPWPYGCYAWQTLTTGIRLESTWPDALTRCLGSPAMTDEALTTILKSVCEQARHLTHWFTGGNWLTEECMGVYTAGMLFPEFKEAREWRRIALERLYQQMDDEVYPDGMEYELAAGYSNWVVSNYHKILDLAALNDLQAEVPADYRARLEKCYNYLAGAAMPNGAIPGLNDSGNADVRGMLSKAYTVYPAREDFLYVATGGARGKAPAQTSFAFPYTGHYVMRSGWDADACYLLFDSGPYGYGHQHEDKLHFVLWAYGKQHVLDPGNYSYDASKWRRYVLTTPGHNTVMLDGEGQHRAGRRQTNVWPKPWNTPTPTGDDTRWVSTPAFDFAAGTYRDGYGPKNDTTVTHTRRVLFVKGTPASKDQSEKANASSMSYYVLLDTLSAAPGKPHRCEALFHLDAPTAALNANTLAVATQNADASNLAVIPLAGDGLKAEIVSGREEPVQGWSNGPWRAVPTIVYSKEAPGTVRFVTVLLRVPKGQPVPAVTVEALAPAGADAAPLAVRITFPDGRVDFLAQSDTPGKEVRFGAYATDGEVAVVRTGPDGKVRAAFQAGGRRVTAEGKEIGK